MGTAKELFVSTTPGDEGPVPVLRRNMHLGSQARRSVVVAFKLPRHPWRVYHGGTAKNATQAEMSLINEVYEREGKVRP